MRNIYPFGKAPFVILIIAIISGVVFGVMRLRETGSRPDLILAIQAEIHVKPYQKAIDQFNKENFIVDEKTGERRNVKVVLQRVQKEVLMSRLQSAMQTGCDVPDVVEILEGTIGYFTRGPLENVGFVDLTERLREDGLLDPANMVQTRYPLWSSREHIFALPHDVHPTCLCYRVDLIQELGIDVTKLKTWDDFVKEGQRITIPQKRYMIDMADDSMISLIILLSQRGFDLFDAYGNVSFDRPEVAEVVDWFVHQTSGKNRIAFPAGDGQNFYQAMNEGLDLFFFTPDWRTAQFQLDNPRQKGNLALMPLPYWGGPDGEPLPGSYKTGTWGGTGLAITKHSKNQELAWKFAKYLYTKTEDLGERFALTNIVPPIKASWELPEFKQKSDFYKHMFHDEATGELKADFVSIGEMYASQADFTPPRYVTAYTTQAETQLLNVYYAARDHYLKHGDEGLREMIQKNLNEKAEYVRSLVSRNVFLTRDAEKAAASKAAADNKSEQEQ